MSNENTPVVIFEIDRDKFTEEVKTHKRYQTAHYNNFLHRCVNRNSDFDQEEVRIMLDFIKLLDIKQVNLLASFIRV